MSGISVLGGQLSFPKMTSKIEDVEYAKFKTHMWLHMLNEGKKPKKWLKANTKGTKVNFEMIKSQEEYDSGISDLSSYCNAINEQFGLDFKINKS